MVRGQLGGRRRSIWGRGDIPSSWTRRRRPAGLLAELPVGEPASMQGYDRALFGQRWSDDVRVQGGRNGCDTP